MGYAQFFSLIWTLYASHYSFQIIKHSYCEGIFQRVPLTVGNGMVGFYQQRMTHRLFCSPSQRHRCTEGTATQTSSSCLTLSLLIDTHTRRPQIQNKMTSTTCVHAISEDVLLMIFTLVLPELKDGNFFSSRMRIQLVCRRWYQLVNDCGIFWAMIGSDQPLSELANALQKSRNSPLTINFDERTSRDLYGFLDMTKTVKIIMAESYRWKKRQIRRGGICREPRTHGRSFRSSLGQVGLRLRATRSTVAYISV